MVEDGGFDSRSQIDEIFILIGVIVAGVVTMMAQATVDCAYFWRSFCDQGDRHSIFDQFGNRVQVMVWCRVVDVQYGQAKACGR
jgi:hypothetical protein